MNSSTSSFRTELKVLGLVLLVVACAEAFFPLMGTRFSRDLKEIDVLDQKLRAGCATQDCSAVILGNSLTLHGFDQKKILAAGPDGFCKPVQFTFVIFQGAFMTETLRIYKHYINPMDKPPRLLIIPFAQNGLADQSGVEIERMVYHCNLSELHEVIRNEIGLGQLGGFLHCFFNRAFANRLRVRQFVFERLLPDYHDSEARLSWANRLPLIRSRGKSDPTFDKLEQIFALCSSRNIQIVLLAMPIQIAYDFRPEMIGLGEKYKVDLLDMRNTAGLDGSKYIDGTHMNTEGAHTFTSAFLDRFGKYLETRKFCN
ncbi:MAG: hypothetical protein WCJ35_04400 [Planctomycetota bacterium]